MFHCDRDVAAAGLKGVHFTPKVERQIDNGVFGSIIEVAEATIRSAGGNNHPALTQVPRARNRFI